MEISLIGILGNVIGKAKSICILLFLTVISSFAQSYIQLPQEGYYETKVEAELYLDAFRNECISVKDGGGGSFSGAVYSQPITPDPETGDFIYNYYIRFTCNTCSSANQTQAIEDYKSTCREQCLSVTPLCQAEVWGSTILNTDCDLGLPITTGECAESSSSIESSSSEESSSSVASSSSVEGGSSASEPTSSTTVNSSTSITVVTPLSDFCYRTNSSSQCVLNSNLDDHLNGIPPMDGTPTAESFGCSGGYFVIQTNIPQIESYTVWCRNSTCSASTEMTAYYWNYGTLTSNGVAPLPGIQGAMFYCNSTYCYAYVRQIFLPSNVSASQIYTLADSLAVDAGYSDRAAYADYCASLYSSSSVEGGSSSATPISSSSGDGSSSSEESHESSSSGNDEISSSSASDVGSSNSIGINSSTSGTESGESSGSVSSSSEVPYESSSSGSEETGSSSSGSDESSSSSASGIDSSCPDCETNVRSAEAVYTSDQIFNSGLENMEDGKCYSLNPDRGTQYGWINNNAQDSWWWVEVPCDGSAPEEESTSAGCVENQRGSNAVYTSTDCFSSSLDNMEEGKCYSLNPDRGTQYGWINNNAQDSWWWVETPCEAEEYANTCPDDAFLYKKTTAQAIEASSENNSTYTLEMPKVFYDALGRKTTDSPKTKRPLFQRNIKHQTPTDINLWSEETSIYLESISVECGNNSKGEWICEEVSGESVLKKSGDDSSGIDTCGILGGDYGIVESNGSLRGGWTCVHTAFKVLILKHPNSEIGQCNDGSKLLKASFTLKTTPSTLSRNDPFSVPAGYVFPNGYTATKEDETAMHYHELGHVKYNTCIKFPAIKKAYSLDCVCESELEKTYNETIDTLTKIGEKRDKKLLDDTGELFHQKYGTGGYAKTYTCPED